MKYIVLIARIVFGLCAIALLVLGGLFWSGHALSLLPVHMTVGTLFVICMWVFGVVGLLTPGNRPLAVIVLVWSFVVPALGVTQLQLLPGADHWVIQAVHLLVGLIAMGLGASLARRLARRPADAAPAAESV